MNNLSDLELCILQTKAESAERVLSRAIEYAEKEKREISDIIERVQDERHRREDREVRQRMKVL